MWKSLDKRVASFLLEETSIEETNELKITHETIANHLGSHREVITRMLRYFQGEGLVKLSRGKITILDSKKTGNTPKIINCFSITYKKNPPFIRIMKVILINGDFLYYEKIIKIL